MSKGSGGTRAKNSSTAHAGGGTSFDSMKSKAIALSSKVKSLDSKMKEASASNSSSWFDLHSQYSKAYAELNNHLDAMEKKHQKKFNNWYYSIDDLF